MADIFNKPLADAELAALQEALASTRSVYDYSEDELMKMMNEGLFPTVGPCDCMVEPDGECPHGIKSILLEAGMI
jgi:hypothetical protein